MVEKAATVVHNGGDGGDIGNKRTDLCAESDRSPHWSKMAFTAVGES